MIKIIIGLLILQLFEIINLGSESFTQRSISLFYKVINRFREKGFRSIAQNWIKDQKTIRSTKYRINALNVIRIWSVDAYGNLVHSIYILFLTCIVSSLNSEQWVILFEIVVISLVSIILVVDLLIWLSTSIELVFIVLFQVVEILKLEKDIFPSSLWKNKALTLKSDVSKLNIGALFPYFVSRFVVVIIIIVIAFAFEYLLISKIDTKSFVDASGNFVTAFGDFLYRSVMLTTTFGPPYDSLSSLAKFVTALHAIITLVILVIVITFFSSISESKLQLEKERFLLKLDSLLKDSSLD